MQYKIIEARKSRAAAAGVLLVATLGFVMPGTSSAAQPPTQHVRITDLDLATPRGQNALEHRLRAAIDEVCVHPNAQLPQTRQVQQGIHTCQARARADAQRQLLDHGFQVPALRSVRRD